MEQIVVIWEQLIANTTFVKQEQLVASTKLVKLRVTLVGLAERRAV